MNDSSSSGRNRDVIPLVELKTCPPGGGEPPASVLDRVSDRLQYAIVKLPADTWFRKPHGHPIIGEELPSAKFPIFSQKTW